MLVHPLASSVRVQVRETEAALAEAEAKAKAMKEAGAAARKRAKDLESQEVIECRSTLTHFACNRV